MPTIEILQIQTIYLYLCLQTKMKHINQGTRKVERKQWIAYFLEGVTVLSSFNPVMADFLSGANYPSKLTISRSISYVDSKQIKNSLTEGSKIKICQLNSTPPNLQFYLSSSDKLTMVNQNCVCSKEFNHMNTSGKQGFQPTASYRDMQNSKDRNMIIKQYK